MRGSILFALALVALAACKEEPAKPKRPGFSFAAGSASAGVKPAKACTFGADETCNDDPLVSTPRGTCNQDGTCSCQPGYAVSSTTGRCK